MPFRDNTMPKIYGLLIAKDEDDIIGQSIKHALAYCDKIIVLDNMSDDTTWTIIKSLSNLNPGRVIAHSQVSGRFHDGMRAPGYNAFKHELSTEDWWLRLDADEFLHDDPQVVIEQANRERADFVRANMMNFELTEIDLADIKADRDSRESPIEQRRHYYRVNWREYRFFRNNPLTDWNVAENQQFPQNLSLNRVASKGLFIRHYGNRDVDQLIKRTARRFGSPAFSHVTNSEWRQYTRSSRTLHYFSPGGPVKYQPLYDFWPRRTWLELKRRSPVGRLSAALQRLRGHS